MTDSKTSHHATERQQQPTSKQQNTAQSRSAKCIWVGVSITLVGLLAIAGIILGLILAKQQQDALHNAMTTWQTTQPQLETNMTQIKDQLGQLQMEFSDQQTTNTSLSQAINMLQTNLASLRQNMPQVDADWTLLEVHYLLNVAQLKLSVQKDIQGTLFLLQRADDEVNALNDPRLMPLRQALRDDITQLQSTQPLVDIEGMIITLNSLSGHIGTLSPMPLAATPRLTPQPTDLPDESPTTHKWLQWVKTAWMRTQNTLQQSITIRRHDEPVAPLLSEAQQVMVQQYIQLNLQQAAVALMNGQQDLYTEVLAHAEDWIRRYYGQNETSTLQLLASIDRLKTTSINPPLPNLNTSLGAIQSALTLFNIDLHANTTPQGEPEQETIDNITAPPSSPPRDESTPPNNENETSVPNPLDQGGLI